MGTQDTGKPWLISVFLLAVFLIGWHLFTLRASFDPKGLSDEQLQLLEFNGDVVKTADGRYEWNPEKEKVKGVPGPLAVIQKAREELGEAFIKKGTNDHGIAYLVLYTISRFAGGFLAASVVAMALGVLLGLNRVPGCRCCCTRSRTRNGRPCWWSSWRPYGRPWPPPRSA
jgi:nitrate/nitrite transport system permease protein